MVDEQTELTLRVASEVDMVISRQRARELATDIGFSLIDSTVIATAISEIARNVVNHAGDGEIVISAVRGSGRAGICVVVRDQGPGISDIERAMQEGYSSVGGFGLGLSSAQRLMDEFNLESSPGLGTTVTMKKWLP
jgi:serine/threonine-protein kinase RsbT